MYYVYPVSTSITYDVWLYDVPCTCAMNTEQVLQFTVYLKLEDTDTAYEEKEDVYSLHGGK